MPGSDQSWMDNVIHVIQVALTPVFLLTAVAALLNVFSTRLGRVADRVDQVSASLQRLNATDAAFLSGWIIYDGVRSSSISPSSWRRSRVRQAAAPPSFCSSAHCATGI